MRGRTSPARHRTNGRPSADVSGCRKSPTQRVIRGLPVDLQSCDHQELTHRLGIDAEPLTKLGLCRPVLHELPSPDLRYDHDHPRRRGGAACSRPKARLHMFSGCWQPHGYEPAHDVPFLSRPTSSGAGRGPVSGRPGSRGRACTCAAGAERQVRGSTPVVVRRCHGRGSIAVSNGPGSPAHRPTATPRTPETSSVAEPENSPHSRDGETRLSGRGAEHPAGHFATDGSRRAGVPPRQAARMRRGTAATDTDTATTDRAR